MNLLTYTNSIELKIKDHPGRFIESFLKSVQEKLRSKKFRTAIENNSISFKRVIHYNMGERDGLNILREGVIKLEQVDSMKVRIEWEVKLDTILFLSVFVGLIVGLITGLVSSMIVAAIISGLLFSIIGYFIGCSFIEEQINEIVETTVNQNH